MTEQETYLYVKARDGLAVELDQIWIDRSSIQLYYQMWDPGENELYNNPYLLIKVDGIRPIIELIHRSENRTYSFTTDQSP